MASLPKPRLRTRTARRRVARATPTVAQQPKGPRIEEVNYQGLRWVNIERPGPPEQAWLQEHFEFHELDYEDVASRSERPKVDSYPDYLFIVLHFPVFDKVANRLNAGELDMFVGSDYVITLPNQPIKSVEYLFERCRSREESREQFMAKGPGFLLYAVVDQSFDYCFPMLAKIGSKVDRLEEDVFEGRSHEVVKDLATAKLEIINFRKITRPQRPVLRDLEKTKHRFLSEDMELYFDDIIDTSERIWDMLENYNETITALENTNESVIGHRVNDILRVLTAFSVVVLPLTLIASIWGMNVQIPGKDTVAAFWIIIAAMVTLLGGMLAYFRYRDWL